MADLFRRFSETVTIKYANIFTWFSLDSKSSNDTTVALQRNNSFLTWQAMIQYRIILPRCMMPLLWNTPPPPPPPKFPLQECIPAGCVPPASLVDRIPACTAHVGCLPKGGGQNVDRCKNTTLPQLRRGRLIYLPDRSFDKLCDFLTKYSDTGT